MSLAHQLDQGIQMSPNFFEVDPIDVLTSPTPLNSISCAEDSHRNVFTGKPNAFYDDDFCDNAVDPDIYLNHASKQSARSPLNYFEHQHAANSSSDPLIQDSHLPQAINNTPLYERQQSLNLVMEVLGSCPVNDSNWATHDVSYPLTPSPELRGDFPAIPARERHFTESDCDFFTSVLTDEPSRPRYYSADLESVHTLHHEVGQSRFDTVHHTNVSVSNEACTSQSDIVDDCPSLESLPSFVRDAVKNSQHLPVIVEDSLDVSAMLNDVLESSQSVLEVYQPSTTCVETNPPTEPVVDLTRNESPPPKMVRTSSYKRKRDQNNKACRNSRKKRKMKQSEAEEKVKELTEENHDLRSQIARLEKETKIFNDLLVARISANIKK